ncbi:ATP binding [Coemansia sp. RSA 1939]|nr:ATP binding [Coemansia sp. RSA 1939]
MKSPTVYQQQAIATVLSGLADSTDTYHHHRYNSNSSGNQQEGGAPTQRYTMQQVLQWNEEKVSRWVSEQGFGRYEAVFRENMITGEALVELDYNLLKELSVRTVGERVRLNLAIRRLRQQCLQIDTDEPASLASTTTTVTNTSNLPSLSSSSRPKRSATLEYGNIRDSLAMHASPALANMSGATAADETAPTATTHYAPRSRGLKDPPTLARASLSSNSVSIGTVANAGVGAAAAGEGDSNGNGTAGNHINSIKSPSSASSASGSTMHRANTDTRAFASYEQHRTPPPPLAPGSHNTPILGNIMQRKMAQQTSSSSSHSTSAAKTVQPLQPLRSSSQQSSGMFSVELGAAAANTAVPKNSKLSLKPIPSHNQQQMVQSIEPMSAPLPRLRMLTSSSANSTSTSTSTGSNNGTSATSNSSNKQNKRSPPSVQPLQLLKDAAESRGLRVAQSDEIERLGLQFQEFFGTDISVTRLADSLSVRTWSVTVTGPENEVRQVAIANASSAHAILDRVRREFGLKNDSDGDQYSLFSMTSASGGARCLSNEELERMFADPTRAPPDRFFLRKRHQLSRPPVGTKRSEHLQRAIEKLGNIIPVSSLTQQQPQPHQLQIQLQLQNPQLQRPSSKWDNTTEKLTKILGERPPSELVSMNVEKYFPGNEARARHSIMRRRKHESHDTGFSLIQHQDGADLAARLSKRHSRAHRRSTSANSTISTASGSGFGSGSGAGSGSGSGSGSASMPRIMHARMQSTTMGNTNRWSILPSNLEPIEESLHSPATASSTAAASSIAAAMSAAPADDNGDSAGSAQESANAPAIPAGGAPSEPDPTSAVAVKSENGAAAAAAATLRKGKRMSRNYTSSTMVQTMHSISSESLQLSDAGSNISDIHGRHGDDDDDSDGSLSDLSSSSSSSSYLSDSVESDDDSFYDSLYDSDIDADENLAADDDESDLHASVSAVGSASVASAMHVQGSDKSTDMLHVSAATATAATAGGSGSTADQNKSVSRSTSAASRNGRTHSNSNANAGANSNSSSSAAPAAPAKKKAWIKGAPIASGSFGSVYFGMNTRTGAIMAVKEVELPTPGSVSTSRNHRMVDALKHELDLLKGLDHKNVVKYLGTDMDDTNLYIFLEYVSGGSVSSALASFGMFPESLVRTYTAQILEGLVYLHAQGIIHRDIKGGNVLIDQDGSVKISDFGISKRVDEVVAASKKDRRASLQGSVFWMAPEVVKDTHYTFKGDVWSLGCLVIEMMTGSHPFPELDQLQALYSIGQRGRPKIPDAISPHANDFLELTLQVDVDTRPTATDLTTHAFVCDIAPPSP